MLFETIKHKKKGSVKMEQVLINQKTLKQRKSIKQIQKAAIGKYGRGHGAVAKARIGKLVSLWAGSSENKYKRYNNSRLITRRITLYYKRKQINRDEWK